MRCRQVKSLMDDYITGRLSPGKDRDMARHLQDCQKCREETEFLRTYLGQIKTIPDMKAPDGFLAGIRSGITAGNKGLSPGLPGRFAAFLFLPLKIKLPIEVAGLLATACITYFFIIPFIVPFMDHSIQIVEYAPEKIPSKSERNKTVSTQRTTTVSLAAKSRRTRELPAVSGEKSPDILEINLAVNQPGAPQESLLSDLSSRAESSKEEFASDSLPSPSMESAGIKARSSVSKSKSESQVSRSRAESRVNSGTSPTAAVRNIALSVNGKIIGEKRPSAGKPASVTVELPQYRYIDFINKIDSIGAVKDKPADSEELNRRTITIQVNVIHSEKSN